MLTKIDDFIWTQTITHITIEIHLKGVVQSKLDILLSSRYIKVIYEQKLFELIFLSSIYEKSSKCIITPESIIFELKKCEALLWGTLEPNLTKKEKHGLKSKLLEMFYKQIQKENEEKNNQKAELKRIAVRKQLEMDSEIRNTIENVKNQEKEFALGDTEGWIQEVSKKLTQNCNSLKNKLINESERELIQPRKGINRILPRQVKSLQVFFTPREFPTPSRESQLAEENEWLSKQAVARRSCDFVSEDIRPEECSPQFVKAKGDEFLRKKNYRGAISAYTFGIKISPEFVDFYVSRSEAHFELGENKT